VQKLLIYIKRAELYGLKAGKAVQNRLMQTILEQNWHGQKLCTCIKCAERRRVTRKKCSWQKNQRMFQNVLLAFDVSAQKPKWCLL
jgi:hypothetical protein